MKLTDITSRHDIAKYLTSRNLTVKGVEVGVLRGDLSKSILRNWPGTLYMVDAWRTFEDLVDLNNGNHIEHLTNYMETFKNVYEFGPRAVIIRQESVEAAKLFDDYTLDFVYLDAGHDYAHVKADLEAWYPKIKDGGLFCGDDYLDAVLLHRGATVFEVKRAVDDFAKKENVEVVSTNNGYNEFPQWWIQL